MMPTIMKIVPTMSHPLPTPGSDRICSAEPSSTPRRPRPAMVMPVPRRASGEKEEDFPELRGFSEAFM